MNTNPRPDLFTSKHCRCKQCGKTTLNTISQTCDSHWTALFHAPMTESRMVGSVDATRDSARPTPRSLDQCRGMQRSSTAVLVPADAAQRFTRADKVLFILGAVLMVGLPLYCHFN